jgi:hypothetical protein
MIAWPSGIARALNTAFHFPLSIFVPAYLRLVMLSTFFDTAWPQADSASSLALDDLVHPADKALSRGSVVGFT